MKPLEGPGNEELATPIQFSLRSFLIAVSLLAVAISFVTCNVFLYQHSRSLEYQYRQSLTEVRPWVWPEGVLGCFVLASVLALIVSSVAVFRVRNRLLKYAAVFFVAGALVALVVNAYFLMLEAFDF